MKLVVLIVLSAEVALASRLKHDTSDVVEDNISSKRVAAPGHEENAFGLRPNQYVLAFHRHAVAQAADQGLHRTRPARFAQLMKTKLYGPVFCQNPKHEEYQTEGEKPYINGYWLKLNDYLTISLSAPLCFKITCPASGESADIRIELIPCGPAADVIRVVGSDRVPNVPGLRLLEVTNLFVIHPRHKFMYCRDCNQRNPDSKFWGATPQDMLISDGDEGFKMPWATTEFAAVPHSRSWDVAVKKDTCDEMVGRELPDVSDNEKLERCKATDHLDQKECVAGWDDKLKEGPKGYLKMRKHAKKMKQARTMVVSDCDNYEEAGAFMRFIGKIVDAPEKTWEECQAAFHAVIERNKKLCFAFDRCGEAVASLTCGVQLALPRPKETQPY